MAAPSLVDALILAAATARLTRLAVHDDMPLLRRARRATTDWIEDRAPGYGDLPHCAWCAGVWIGAAVALAHRAAPRATRAVCLPLALAHAAGLSADREVS